MESEKDALADIEVSPEMLAAVAFRNLPSLRP